MRDFLVWVFSYRKGHGAVLQQATTALAEQSLILEMAASSIEEWQQRSLAAVRVQREIATAWRAHCDSPEVDIREDLDNMIRDIADNVAMMEERLPS